jgi:hypothetical protein
MKMYNKKVKELSFKVSNNNFIGRLLSVFFLILYMLSAEAQFSYIETAQSFGITHQSGGSNYGGPVSVSDFDGDGFDDITLGGGIGDSIQFYRNLSGTGFQRVYLTPVETGLTKQILWADYDNDGDQDLFVATYGEQNNLYINDGGMNLVNVTSSVGLPIINDPTWAAAWGDYDRDGCLDLMVTTFVYGTSYSGLFQDYILRNQGDGTFLMLTSEVGIPAYDHDPLVVVFMDYDNDLWPDIFIASDRPPSNRLLRNNSRGMFTDVTVQAGANQQIDAMSAAVGDYDGNGYLDVYSTNSPEVSPGGAVLIQNNGNGTFTETSSTAGVDFNGEGWAASFIDFDNDSDMDLYVSGMIHNGTPNGISNTAAMFDNEGNGTFSELLSGIGMQEDTKASYAHSIGDFNNDGFADIIVNNYLPDTSQLWMHTGGTNNFINIKLQGTVSNRDGIGAWIKLYMGGTQYVRYTHHGLGFMGQNTTDGLFGLGTNTMVDSINIFWPSGHKDQLLNVSGNQILTILEGTTGSVQGQVWAKGALQICQGNSVELYTLGKFAQYNWSTGETTSSITANSPGYYSVTITDSYGGISTDSLLISAGSALNTAVTSTGIVCYGENNGTASAIVPGNTTQYTYQWSNGNSNYSVNNLSSGAHSLIVFDSLNCRDTVDFLIAEALPLSINASPMQIACFGDATGSIDLSVTGGVAPYSFNWSNSETTEDISGLSLGNYSVFITDTLGCSDLFTSIIYSPLSSIQASSISTNLSCFGSENGYIDLTVTGGVAPYSYLWSNSDTTEDLSGLQEGLYQVTVTDMNGCIYITMDSLSKPDSILVQLSVEADSMGAGGSISTLLAGGVGAYSYLWSNGQTTNNISGVPAGMYTLTVTDAQGCTDTTSVIVPMIQFTTLVTVSNLQLVKIYPNPSTGYLNIEFLQPTNGKYSIRLFNILGEVLYHREFNNISRSLVLDLNNIPTGNYIVQILSSDNYIHEKISIE